MTETQTTKHIGRCCLWMTLAVALGLIIWAAYTILLVLFSSVLLAVFLHALSRWTCRLTGLDYARSLALVILVLLVLSGLTGWLLAPAIGNQFERLTRELPQAWAHFQNRLENAAWYQQIQSVMPQSRGAGFSFASALQRVSGIVSSTLGWLVNIFIFFVVGIYLAAAPRVYLQGLIRLLPPPRRQRATEVADTLGITLQRWLVGRIILMGLNGVATAMGLWLLGVPLAPTLGLIAGLLNFVPNLGPIIASIPAILLGLVQGPWTALYVALFYLGYQMLDGYVLTPLVQKQTVSLPPALIITSQVIFGVFFGVMGVLLAVPIVAVAFVIIKMVYLHDLFGDRISLPGK